MRFLVLLLGIFFVSIANSQQTYPNVDGETLLEDDRIIVQRFVLEPGQWEGIHEHPEHQLVIVLSSTEEVRYRFGDKERVFKQPEDEPVDKVRAFWRPGPVHLSQQHESGNTGTRPLEWIAITFKSDSIKTDNPPARFVQPVDE